jgi:ATP adenylyltransferase
MNRYPYNVGHIMVVPYVHTASIGDLTAKAHGEIMQTIAYCIEALKKNSKPQGFNFGANLGRVSGAGIEKHVHFHLVPRWNGDTNFLPVLSDTKLISEDIHKTWKTLTKELNGSR